MNSLTAPSRRMSVGLAASAMVIAALLWLRWASYDGENWVDFNVYVRGGLAVLRGEPLYGVRVGGLPFTYSPFAAALFTHLSVFPVAVARWLFTVGSLICYVAIVVVSARSARIGWKPATMAGAAGLTLEPFFTTIDLGQIDLYLICMVILDCLLVPARYRGWLVGLAAGVKILPGVFVLFFVLTRDWAAARRMVSGFAISVACGALVLPGDSFRYWSGGFTDVTRFGDGAALRVDNQSLSAEFIRLSHDVTPPAGVLIGLSALALLVATMVARQQIYAGRPLDAVVALGLGSLLASPVSWTHHWLWVVPLLVVTVSRRWLVASWTLGGIFLIGPMAFIPMGSFRELNHSWWEATLSASYLSFGITMLVRLFLVRAPRRTA